MEYHNSMKSWWALFILLFVFYSCGRGASSPDLQTVNGSIWNGTAEDVEKYPFVANLKFANTGHTFCSGVLVAPNKVLTAAHCLVDDTKLDKTDEFIQFMLMYMRVGLGKSEYKINAIRLQADYLKVALTGQKRNTNDIAMIELSEAVSSSIAKPVALVDENDIDHLTNQSVLVAISFGRGNDNKSGNLNSLNLKTAGVYKESLDLLPPSGTALCVGDSGGPVFLKDSQGQLKLLSILDRGFARLQELPCYEAAEGYLPQKMLEFLKDDHS